MLKKSGKLPGNATKERKLAKKEKRPDPRIQRTRQFIREAFLDLLVEKGYDAITISAITERAMVNRATFYLHYLDKQDLLNQSIEEVLQELVTFQESHIPDADALISHVVYFFDHVARHAFFYKILLAKLQLPVLYSRLTKILNKAFSEALTQFQPDEQRLRASKDIVICYVVGAQMNVLIWWLDHDMPYTSQYMAKQLFSLATSGYFHAIGKEVSTIESHKER